MWVEEERSLQAIEEELSLREDRKEVEESGSEVSGEVGEEVSGKGEEDVSQESQVGSCCGDV